MEGENESLPQDTAAMLRRVLSAVEPTKRKPGFELACAIVLALATTASAWCAYQSKLWGGVQASRAGTAVRAGREGAVNSLAAMQLRAFDASMFIAYMQARFGQNKDMEAFLAQRFRPEMKPAVEAWLKLDPLNNPAAPPSPFRMAEYAQAETVEAARQAELAARAMAATGEARRLRLVPAALAVLLFPGTLVALTTTPICHE
jgi:hypothetical protein